MENLKQPERKDRTYFMSEIERLYNEATISGEEDISIILASIMTALLAGNETSLSAKCALFSKETADRIRGLIKQQS